MMTIKKAILPLLFLSISTSITAGVVVESTYKMTGINVQGHVIDSKTKEYVPYVLVAVKGTTLATTTDAKGFYSIKNIPQGKVILEVKHLGYHNASVTLKTEKEETLEQDFELTDDVLSLDEVVLTANRQQTLRREAPVLVNVIDKRLFNLTNSATLSQGLNFQPGVRTENNCQNCGFSQVRINGLDGHYSQILIDSRPVFSALNGVYGLEQIPSSMIERVEVVRGGGSSLYGASAIGGTINVITKEPIRNSAEVGHTLSSYGNHSGWENTTNLNASIVTEDAKGGLFIYGNHHYRPGYDHNNDGYTELPNLKNQTLGFSAFYKFTPYSRITLRYHNLAEFRRGGNHLERAPHESDITEQLEHDVNGGSLAYDLFSKDTKRQLKLYYSFENTARKSYYGGIGGGTQAADTIKSAKAYGRTKEITHLLGVQYVHSFDNCWFMPATLTAGLEYNNDKMNDEVLGYDHYLNQRVSIGSAYFQNEWKDSRFTFLLGARLDKHNLIKNAVFSPRVNFRYNPSKELSLRLSYAEGFRAPQAFDEDLHTGWTDGSRQIIVRDPNLKEERSRSISASADFYHTFGSVQTNFLIEGFFTHLTNAFATRTLDKGETTDPNYENNIRNIMQRYGLSRPNAEENEIAERFNGNNATIFGLNIEAKAAFSQWLQVQAGLTLQRNMYKDSVEWSGDGAKKERRFLKTPNAYGYFTVNIQPLKNLSVALTGTYTGSMLVGHQKTDDYTFTQNGTTITYPGWAEAKAVNTPSFLSMNLKVAYDIQLSQYIKMQINGGFQNITNAFQRDLERGPLRDADYVYGPGTPRCAFLGVKFSY